MTTDWRQKNCSYHRRTSELYWYGPDDERDLDGEQPRVRTRKRASQPVTARARAARVQGATQEGLYLVVLRCEQSCLS